MADTLAVNLSLTGADRAIRELRQVAAAFRDVNQAMRLPGGGARGTRASAQPRQPRQPPTFQDKLMRMLSSSRIGVGGGGGASFMPLLGQVMKLLGPEVVVIAGAFIAMAKAADEATKSINEFRKAMFTAGGTTGETARLQGLSGILGRDAAESARDLAARIGPGGDPMSQAAAQRLGIHSQGIFGDLDDAKVYLRAIENIRKMDYREALRTARMLGHDELMIYRDVSDQVIGELKRDAEMRAGLMTPKDVQNAADFNAEMKRLSLAFDTLGISLGKHFIPALSTITEKTADLVLALTRFLDSDFMQGLLSTIIPWFYQSDKGKNQKSSLDRNTDAVDKNTYAIQNGIFGGGPRAQGAIPKAWGPNFGYNWDRIGKQAMNLGAFAL